MGRICLKVGFEPGVKEWRSDGWLTRVGMMTEMGWQADEEVNRDKTGEGDEVNLAIDSKVELMHIWKWTSDLWLSTCRPTPPSRILWNTNMHWTPPLMLIVYSTLEWGMQSATEMLPLKRGEGVAHSFDYTSGFVDMRLADALVLFILSSEYWHS